MLSNSLTEDFDHKVRKSINYCRLIAEALRRVDHAEHLNDAFDPIEAAERTSDFGQHDESSLTSRRTALLDREILSNLSIGLPLWAGGVTGKKEQIANSNSIYVIGNRRRFRGQRNILLFQSSLCSLGVLGKCWRRSEYQY